MKKNLLSFVLLALAAFLCGNLQAQTLIDEHFDAFTEGSEDNPATTDISGYSGKLFKTLKWNGKSVYEAGCKLLIKDGGNLITSSLSALTTESAIKVTFDAKCPSVGGGALKVNFNYAYSGDQTVLMGDNDWHTFSVVFDKATSTKSIKFTPFLAADGILIDNVKVEAGMFVKSPEAYQPETVSPTDFTAIWSAVNDATSYLLDVYTKNGEEKIYLLKDEEVAETSKDVTGLERGKQYFFTVRAKKGEGVSDPSNEIRVVEVFKYVLPPKGLPATDVTKNGFTANWEAAEHAVKYDIYMTRTEKLDEAREVNIIDESFDKVTIGTLQKPEFNSSATLDAFTSAPGWTSDRMQCLAAGYMGLSPFGMSGSIFTPDMDLSSNGGAFTVKMNMAELNYGQPSSGTPVELRLYNKNERLLETKSVTLEKGFKEYVLEFTKGTAGCFLQIYYKNLDGETKDNKLFIDYIKVAQTLAAGTSYSSLIEQREVGNATSSKFELPVTDGVSYSYSIVSYAYAVLDHELTYVGSGQSDPITVSTDDMGDKTVILDPKEGKVASLKEFKITFTEYQYVDIAADSYAGAATLTNDDTNEETVLDVVPSSATLNVVKLILPKEITAAGNYTLHIPSGKLYDGMDPDETDLPEYNFHYTIDGTVEPPVEEPEVVTADPADGSTVAELSKIMITFQTDEDVYAGSGTIEVVNDATGEVVTKAKASTGNVADAQSGYAILDTKITANGSYTIKFASGAFVKGTLSRAEETRPFELHYTVDVTLGIGNAATAETVGVVLRTNVAGQRIAAPQKGINILKLDNGKTVKVMK